MKKLNTAIITIAAVMSISASALAAPLCTSTLCTNVLKCTGGSTNCNINSVLAKNCTADIKENLQYFINLGCQADNSQTTKTNCVGNDCGSTNAPTTKDTAKNTAATKDTTKNTTTATDTTKNTVATKDTTKNTTTTKDTTKNTATTKDTTKNTATTKDTTKNTVTTNTNTSASSYAQEVVNLVNAERAKGGLSALSVDAKVASAAQVRAAEIKTSFSHTRPDGRSCFTALAEAGASYSGAGENIAIGQKTPSEVVTAWMNSEGHRKNIMNPNFKYIGIGVDGTAWTQFFTY
jgi:Uncharacterized protein with SCP/PR1 domains